MIILTDSFIGCTKSNKAKGKECSVHGNNELFIMTSVERLVHRSFNKKNLCFDQ